MLGDWKYPAKVLDNQWFGISSVVQADVEIATHVSQMSQMVSADSFRFLSALLAIAATVEIAMRRRILCSVDSERILAWRSALGVRESHPSSRVYTDFHWPRRGRSWSDHYEE
jgi:hypothetical protein